MTGKQAEVATSCTSRQGAARPSPLAFAFAVLLSLTISVVAADEAPPEHRPQEAAVPMSVWTPNRALASQVSDGGCFYRNGICENSASAHFLELWEEKARCWLCPSMKLSAAAEIVMKELLGLDAPTTLGGKVVVEAITHLCLSGYLLAIFASTRSIHVQPWAVYSIGLDIIEACRFDDHSFFELFGIAPAQMIYTFYLLGLPYIGPSDIPLIQAAEVGVEAGLPTAWARMRGGASEVLAKGDAAITAEEAPLVIDIGMGLGGDTHYYLSQGFRVVAVEANKESIRAAVSVPWVQALLATGQLAFLHAAVAAPGHGGGTMDLFTLPDRPEQSNQEPWLMAFGGKPVKVRTLECADLLRLYGAPLYMKVDVESSSPDCIDSIYQAHVAALEAVEAAKKAGAEGHTVRTLPLPRFLSFEMEEAGLGRRFLSAFKELGYVAYKVCRQYVYSPAPCERGMQGSGCGSGPFGEAAVDYLRGLTWTPIDALEHETEWEKEFINGLDWFDLHLKLETPTSSLP